jgi:hypothetical protein
VVRLERHELGPRVYVLGLRVHEVGVGLAVLAPLLVFGATDHWEVTRRFLAAAALGAWLVVKDWRDLVPSQRNTARWSLLIHRRKH